MLTLQMLKEPPYKLKKKKKKPISIEFVSTWDPLFLIMTEFQCCYVFNIIIYVFNRQLFQNSGIVDICKCLFLNFNLLLFFYKVAYWNIGMYCFQIYIFLNKSSAIFFFVNIAQLFNIYIIDYKVVSLNSHSWSLLTYFLLVYPRKSIFYF